MRRVENPKYITQKGIRTFKKSCRRNRIKKALRSSAAKHSLTMKQYADRNGSTYYFRKYKSVSDKPYPPKPPLPEYIQFLSGVKNAFGTPNGRLPEKITLTIPECFSLIENSADSFSFLRLLLDAICSRKTREIEIDYGKCNRIDVDASMCMDWIIAQHNQYIRSCERRGHYDIFPNLIRPINYTKPDILKVLFSIGAYRNIRGLQINFKDVVPLPVLINSITNPNCWGQNEIDLTKIVDYISECLARMGRVLTPEAENEFYKVIGEIMSNAEEHSTMTHRFAIGFFQEHHGEEDFGIFNFSIFNFGDTIYETFKSPKCGNQKIVQQMAELSDDYTKKGWFTKADFKEETLWTLYALQEGVTSKNAKRGNGSIQYIEHFFRLKGNMGKDDISKLLVMSGNTRIMFDGTHTIFKKLSKDGKREYKMITFNDSKDIHAKPDKNFVTFAPQFFPGTMISARILIKNNNTNRAQNEQQ